MNTRREISAGGVVYRRAGDAGLEIVLAARRVRSGDLVWGLPKGLIDEGESKEQAAVREVREETGIEAEIELYLDEISYFYVWEGIRIAKVVHFFLMRATGGDVSRHDHEMEEVAWFPISGAAKRCKYAGEKEMVRLAEESLA